MHHFNHAVVMGDLNLIRCFIEGSIPYVPVATTNNTLILYSRKALPGISISDPSADPDKAVRELIEKAGNTENRPVLYYSNDQQLLMVSDNREELSKYFRFTLPDAGDINAIVNKNLFIDYCKEYDLPVPGTFTREEINQLDIDKDIPFPCVIKPTTRYLWKINGIEPTQKAITVDDSNTLKNILSQIEEDKDFIIQQYIPGTDDLIYSYHAYYDADRNCLASYIGKKVRCAPIHNGYSASVALVVHDELLETGHNIMKRTGLVGPVKIDFKYDEASKKFYLLEINPRFNMWHYLGSVSGINIPGIAYHSLYQEEIPKTDQFRTDIQWFNIRRDLKGGLEAYRSSRITMLEWIRSYTGKKIYDKFAWNDPVPALMGLIFFINNRVKGIFRFLKKS